MPGVKAPCHDEEGNEEADGGNGEDRDGSTKAGAYLRSGAGGGVAAHAAALRVGGGRAAQQHHHEADADEVREAHVRAYWKNTSRLKRKTQKIPIECQYHAVQSTKI
jgi:hypothetical protein